MITLQFRTTRFRPARRAPARWVIQQTDIRRILADNAISDMLEEEDYVFLRAVRAAQLRVEHLDLELSADCNLGAPYSYLGAR